MVAQKKSKASKFLTVPTRPIPVDRDRSDVDRYGIGGNRNRIFVSARRGARDIRGKFRHIHHVLTAHAAQCDDAGIARLL